jgi:hypothetical protein
LLFALLLLVAPACMPQRLTKGPSSRLQETLKPRGRYNNITRLTSFRDEQHKPDMGPMFYASNVFPVDAAEVFSRTFLHEDEGTAANLMLEGDGDSVWVFVHRKHRQQLVNVMRQMQPPHPMHVHDDPILERNGWLTEEALKQLLANNVPVWRFEQKPGDLVLVDGMHQVTHNKVC